MTWNITKIFLRENFTNQILATLAPNLKAANRDADAWKPYPTADKSQVQAEWLLNSSCAYERL